MSGAVIRVSIVVVGVLASVVALAWVFQRSLIYFPDRTSVRGAAAEQFDHAYEVEFHTDDGLVLDAWRVEPTSANGMAVLYLPGNAGNRLHRVGVAQAIADEGFVVLLVDYRGFGGNPGSPSEEGLIRDAEAALAYLRESGFESNDVIYVGESIGTGVAAALATSDPPAGLLLRSPFTSLADVARNQFGVPLGWLLWDQFDTASRIQQVPSPVTVMAGEADRLIPVSMSREVADLAPNLHELIVVPGADHNAEIWFGPFIAQSVASLAALNAPD